MGVRTSHKVDPTTLMWLLRISLFDASSEGFPRLEEQEWDTLFRYAMQHKVLGFINSAISKLPEDCRPSNRFQLRFYAESSRIEATAKRQMRVLRDLVDFFDSMGIRTMLLKGPFLSMCYPEPMLRPFGDLDIYQFGSYIEADNLISKHHGIKVSDASPHHTKYCFQGVTVENHYDFLNTRAIRSNKAFEKLLLSRVGEAEVGGFPHPKVYLPSPTFNALFLIRHLGGHFAAGQVTVRDLCDWRMFLQKFGSQVDWRSVWAEYERFEMHHFVGSLQAILEDWLDLDPIPGLSREQDQLLVERVFNDILFGEFAESDYQGDGFGRLFWKIRRFNANRWKHEIVYSDSRFLTLFSSLYSHLLKPRSILHKV